MAFTVKLASNKKCFLLGDGFKLTTTVEPVGEEQAPSNLSYSWQKNGQPFSHTQKDFTVTNATANDAGTYKVTVKNEDTQEEVTSDVVKIAHAELVVKINQPSQYVAFEEQIQLTATAAFSTGMTPTPDYTLHYAWERNGEPLGNDTETLDISRFTDEHNGVYTVKVWGESELSTDQSSVKLIAVSLSVVKDLPLEKTVVLGKEIILPYQVISTTVSQDTSDLPQLKIKQSWYLQREGQAKPTLLGNDVGEALEGFNIMPNGYLHKEKATHDDHANFWCVAELYQVIQDKETKIEDIGSHHCQVVIVDSLHDLHKYVHPIPWRKTSFMYIGWWVFDEIVKLNENGLDWRDPAVYEDCRYAIDIETIAGAEEKYGDCTCMESRNGFMYNASELHRLDRETFERMCKIRTCAP